MVSAFNSLERPIELRSDSEKTLGRFREIRLPELKQPVGGREVGRNIDPIARTQVRRSLNLVSALRQGRELEKQNCIGQTWVGGG